MIAPRTRVSMRMVAIATVIVASARSHPVAMTPAAVIVAPGFVIAGVVVHSHGSIDAHAGGHAGVQQDQRQNGESSRCPSTTHGAHFGSALLSLLVHSISPNGAPAGSATTATCPP